MWKVQLFCDRCRQACVEAIDLGSKDGIKFAAEKARGGGWVYVRNVGGLCQLCRCKAPMPDLGDYAYYTGSLVTSRGFALKSQRARIIKHDHELQVVHAIFDDAGAGRYATDPHWFFRHEFSPEVTDVQGQTPVPETEVGLDELEQPAEGIHGD